MKRSQEDNGMLKRGNPSHPLIHSLAELSMAFSKSTLQHVWTQSAVSVSWEFGGHALRMFLMSEVKSMVCLDGLNVCVCVVKTE